MNKTRGNAKRNQANKMAKEGNYQDAFADQQASKRKGKWSKGSKFNKNNFSSNTALSTGSGDNDPSWYTKNPTILRNVASIPFSYVTGNRIDYPMQSQYYTSSQKLVVPGIMRIRWAPYIGASTNQKVSATNWTEVASSPINVAGEEAYSYLMKGKSVTKEFDPCDVSMYYLAMDSAYAYYAWLCRIYGVLTWYSPTNKYTPRALVRSMGIDFDEIILHMADFRLGINLYADRLQSMYVPKSVTYITRHIFMSESIYTDGDNSKAQLYYYNPVGFYVFDETTNPNQLTLQTPLGKKNGMIGDSMQDNLLDHEDLLAFGNNLLGPIIASQDLNIISSYVLNAYGVGGIFQVAPIAETFTVRPVYSQEVLSQMENAECVRFGISTKSARNEALESIITPTTDLGASIVNARTSLVSNSLADADVTMSTTGKNRILNFHKNEVSPEDIMVATRMKSIIVNYDVDTDYWTSDNVQNFAQTNSQGNYRSLAITTGGSEICYDFAIINQNNAPSAAFSEGMTYLYSRSYMQIPFSTGITADIIKSYMVNNFTELSRMIQSLAAFDWHPFITLTFAGYLGGALISLSQDQSPIGDYDNFTIISQENLDNMHYYALLSEFTSVPQV